MSAETDIDNLSPEQEKKFAEILAQWSAIATSTAPIGRENAAGSVARVYAQTGESEPTVLYCQSPFQMALIPMLIPDMDRFEAGGFKSSLESKLHSLCPSQIKPQLWTRLGRCLEAQLTAQVGSPIVWSMVQALKQQLLPNARTHFEARFLAHWSSLRKRSVDRILPPPVKMFPGEDLMSYLDRVASQMTVPDWQLRVRQSVVRNAQTFPSQLRPQLEGHLNAGLRRSIRMHELWIWYQRDETRKASATRSPEETRQNMAAIALPLFGWQMANTLTQFEFCQYLTDLAWDDHLSDWIELGKIIHGFLPFQNICFVCDRPTKLTLDESGWLHNANGPAIEYADGYVLYAWHGTRIDWNKAHVITSPDKITVNEIEEEENNEVRRVMIERFGHARFVKESGAQVIDRDTDSHTGDERILYRKEIASDEPVVMVSVKNSTPDPDGSRKEYLLRVPPTVRTAQEAVAWTFGMTKEEYQPTDQS